MGLPAASTATTALVTGASSGIGAAIARELAAGGHALALVARREERLRSLATELTDAHGVSVEVLPCDLGDAGERDRLVSSLNAGGRSVELLVNNAGYGSRGEFVTNDRERMVGMVRLNVEAVVDLTARFLPGMSERGRGAVINIASTAAFQPMPGAATYGASKAFVLSFSEAIRTELRGSGVSVTAVCPGPVKTEFTDAAGMSGVELDPRRDLDERRGDRLRGPGRGRGRQARGRAGGAQPRPVHPRPAQPARRGAAADPARLAGRLEGVLLGLMARLEARGVELEWNQRGRGPSALLVHESATDSRAWAGVAGALAPGARVISYDRRGWGPRARPTTTGERRSRSRARTPPRCSRPRPRGSGRCSPARASAR